MRHVGDGTSYNLSNLVAASAAGHSVDRLRWPADRSAGDEEGGWLVEVAEIGPRVRYWRERRGLTRQHFGDLVGRSPSWVDKIEKGERQLDRLSVLDTIAQALDVPLHVLLDDEEFRLRAQCVDSTEVAAIRRVLQRYEPTAESSAWSEKPLDLTRLQRQVTYAWLAFQASDYTALGAVLAGLLAETERASTELSGGEQATAATLLAQTYQVITSTVRKLGYFDVEWVAADRGIRVADQVQDPVLFGGAAFRLVNAFKDNNGAPAAIEMARRAADITSVVQASGPIEARSMYGHLLLQGAMCAAAVGDAASVRDFLHESRQVAARLGGDRNDYYTAFGPTNVLIHEVAAMVELREWASAIEAAGRIDPSRLMMLPKERRANHLLDVALAYSLAGKRDEALWSLLEADELAPREIRCRPVARDLIADLGRRTRSRPSFELQRLAARAGVLA